MIPSARRVGFHYFFEISMLELTQVWSYANDQGDPAIRTLLAVGMSLERARM